MPALPFLLIPLTGQKSAENGRDRSLVGGSVNLKNVIVVVPSGVNQS